VQTARDRGWGLGPHFGFGGPIWAIATIISFDLYDYWWYRVNHEWSFFRSCQGALGVLLGVFRRDVRSVRSAHLSDEPVPSLQHRSSEPGREDPPMDHHDPAAPYRPPHRHAPVAQRELRHDHRDLG